MEVLTTIMCFIVILAIVVAIVAWENIWDFIKKLSTISFDKNKFQVAVYKKYTKL